MGIDVWNGTTGQVLSYAATGNVTYPLLRNGALVGRTYQGPNSWDGRDTYYIVDSTGRVNYVARYGVGAGYREAEILLHLNALLGLIGPGDVTGDIVVDITDIVALIQNVVFGTPLLVPQVADVTGDSVVDISDVVCLIQHVVFATPLPCL